MSINYRLIRDEVLTAPTGHICNTDAECGYRESCQFVGRSPIRRCNTIRHPFFL